MFAASPPFILFGADHLMVLLMTVVLAVVVIYVARSRRYQRFVGVQNLVLALVLLWTYPAKLLTRYYTGMGIDDVRLPMHFCDWAAMAGVIALIWRKPFACELLYFWGLAGTVQGLLTPAIEIGFPHPSFGAFFLLHSGVVIAALYLPLGLGWRPRPGAFWRVLIFGQFYLLVAGVVDWVTGENYGFLREKPNASLLDALGPWPYYIIGLQVVAALVFFLLYLPFICSSRKKTR
jgi:hypothetical integral membrane protein (TIGR02206 family)